MEYNCTMNISGKFNFMIQEDTRNIKPDIEQLKVVIQNKISNISVKTVNHRVFLYSKYKHDIICRSLVEDTIGVKSSRASEIISILLKADIIEPIRGYGKGKYRFK